MRDYCADYFKPFGIDYNLRKSPTLEFVDYLRAAYGEKQPFSFHGDVHHTDSAQISVQPLQRPHPPIWMMSRDPQTLEFCASNGINPGYFLVYPRADAAPRYRVFLENWKKAGWPRKPNIAYCTIVHVDETDEKALGVALRRAARCPCRKLNPHILMVQPTQDWHREYAADGLYGAAYRRILIQ